MSDEISAAEYVAQVAGTKPRKYRSEPVVIDGIAFDSKLEGRRYAELKLMLEAGLIADLEVHPPAYRLEVNGVLITKYTPDFRYVDVKTGRTVVEDTKSSATKTRAYVMRRKLVKAILGIEIREVAA